MSERRPPTEPRRPMGAPRFAHPGMMAPAEKPKDFRGSARRLIMRLRPEGAKLIAVLLFGIVSVIFAIVGPKMLGQATNVLFQGVVNQRCRPARRRSR